MSRIKRFLAAGTAAFVLCALFAGCRMQEQSPGTAGDIYFLN